MNSRDFCFWLRGYVELTAGEYPASVTWNLILEHLALTQEDENYSRDEFEGVVAMLTGFASIAGKEAPTESQWNRITDLVSDAFDNVTSEIEEDNTLKDIIKEINEKAPSLPLQPFMPQPPQPLIDDHTQPTIPKMPWDLPPQIICSADDSSMFCASTTLSSSVDIACQPVEEGGTRLNVTLDAAYDNQPIRSEFGDMYDIGINLADSKLGR